MLQLSDGHGTERTKDLQLHKKSAYYIKRKNISTPTYLAGNQIDTSISTPDPFQTEGVITIRAKWKGFDKELFWNIFFKTHESCNNLRNY